MMHKSAATAAAAPTQIPAPVMNADGPNCTGIYGALLMQSLDAMAEIDRLAQAGLLICKGAGMRHILTDIHKLASNKGETK
jgi:hypothetical protein